jgi:hypothetical protein
VAVWLNKLLRRGKQKHEREKKREEEGGNQRMNDIICALKIEKIA